MSGQGNLSQIISAGARAGPELSYQFGSDTECQYPCYKFKVLEYGCIYFLTNKLYKYVLNCFNISKLLMGNKGFTTIKTYFLKCLNNTLYKIFQNNYKDT